MIILKILGWVLVVYLIGSLFYSTKFHLQNYHHSEAKDSKIGKDLWESFLNRIMIMQLIKLFIAAFLVSLLTK